MITFVTNRKYTITMSYLELFLNHKAKSLFGRYITNTDIEKCFTAFINTSKEILGYSVEQRPIYGFTFGNGATKVLIWSQMHGNESTSTKALMDCFNGFESNTGIFKSFLETFTFYIIPILNPDGAERYTRLNANLVDLNRDAQDLSQPESKILRLVFNNFKPHYCFNLHGQRTIFSVGNTNVSATLSFLSPAQDEARSLTPNRKTAMAIIAQLNSYLQDLIPNGVARYDDGFNLNCVGDTFQNFGVPTLLFEAGHIPNDYDREVVRELFFCALLKSLDIIYKKIPNNSYLDYFKIPENGNYFYDIIVRNVKLSTNAECVSVAIQYEEQLLAKKVVFIPKVSAVSSLKHFFGHKEFDAKGAVISKALQNSLEVGVELEYLDFNTKKIKLTKD